MNREQIDKLLEPRIIITAPWPYMPKERKVGEVIRIVPKEKLEWWLQFTANITQLEWWEHRTLEEMMSIEYVQIVTAEGYWRVGDIVPVKDYDIVTKTKTLSGYKLHYDKYSTPQQCKPSCKEDYLLFCKEAKLTPYTNYIK